MEFPQHKAALHLTHNDHKNVYQTVEQWDEDQRSSGEPFYDWVSDEQRQRAIETDSVWTLQWYPNTPVGFCALAAADLDVLLAAARKGNSHE